MKKYVLVLGGSTFMGKDLLQSLSSNEDYIVHYINRGKKYWDYAVRSIKNVNYTYGNRDDGQDFTKLLKYLTNKLKITQWEAANQVQQVYDALRGMCNIYIFISTDSLYDVCDRNIRNNPITEDQSIRPQSDALYKQYKSKESYGHHKLKCEEYLQHYTVIEQFPFICLRLPDVIGPFDDSHRFYSLVKWIQYGHPIELDNDAENQQIGLVYSIDVVNLIVQLLNTKIHTQHDKINQSYNITSDQSYTYQQLVTFIAPLICNKQLIFKPIDKASTFYPSVDCGLISNQKAKQLLDFKPTPLEEALKATVKFFVEEAPKYKDENDEAENKLKRKLQN